jgi:group I intron endonuclease
MTYIYLVEIGNNQVYIGKTKNINNRKGDHKRTYGKDIKFTILDQVDSIKHDDWEPLETYWIEQFNAWSFKILNIRKKGGSGSDTWSEESKNKLRKPKPQLSIRLKEYYKTNPGPNKGKIFSEETKNKMKKPRPGSGGKGKPKPKEWAERMSKLKTGKPSNRCKPVLQYDLENNFIKEWSSAQEAIKAGFGDVVSCCNGRQKTAGKHYWKYKK